MRGRKDFNKQGKLGMETIYEDFHLHIGYYESVYDLEAIAFKRKGIHIWDIYFEPNQYDKVIAGIEKKEYLNPFGYKIMAVPVQELTYKDGAQRFEQWLKENDLI
ncbi:DUF3986 family protein [Priestia megaterium]|nr:DUF3986 family protein [Priestia megaterium]